MKRRDWGANEMSTAPSGAEPRAIEVIGQSIRKSD